MKITKFYHFNNTNSLKYNSYFIEISFTVSNNGLSLKENIQQYLDTPRYSVTKNAGISITIVSSEPSLFAI